jgi:hypothetical protein
MTLMAERPSWADQTGDVSGLSRAVFEMLGDVPVGVTVERMHFPNGKPVQSVLCAALRDGRKETLFAEHCPADPQSHANSIRASLSKSRNGQKAGLDRSAVVVAEDAGLVLRRPGLDERLPGLRLLHDPAFARRAVQSVLGRDVGPVVTELVAHRLGKRAVLRISGAGLELFVRLRPIKSGDGAGRLRTHLALWSSLSGQTDLRIPEPLGALPDCGAAVFGVLPGAPADLEDADVDAVARAMAVLRSLDPVNLRVHSGADEARILRHWMKRCETRRPALARRIAPGLSRLMTKLDETASPLRPCHRDLHEKQILVSGGVAGLLDFDTLCLSDPALDVGNLLAHMFFAGQDETRLRAACNLPRVGHWRSAALYRLAMIYAVTSTSEAVLDRLITEADAHADD